MRRHSFARRLALLALRLYPWRWRERYEGELSAILEERGASWLDTVDLFRACVSERALSVARATALVFTNERVRASFLSMWVVRQAFALATFVVSGASVGFVVITPISNALIAAEFSASRSAISLAQLIVFPFAARCWFLSRHYKKFSRIEIASWLALFMVGWLIAECGPPGNVQHMLPLPWNSNSTTFALATCILGQLIVDRWYRRVTGFPLVAR